VSPRLTTDAANRFLAEAFPSAARWGIRCEALRDGTATVRWRFDDAEVLPGGYISGPLIFAVADTALWFATISIIGIEELAVTSEMWIRFVRPARGGDLLARASIESPNQDRLDGTIDLWVDQASDGPVAIARGSYAVR